MNWAEMRDYPKISKEAPAFLSLLERMNELLHLEATKRQMAEQQKKDRHMKVTSMTLFEKAEKPVTRTELLAAYFYYYSLSEQGVGMNMAEMFDDFYALVDPVLEQCRYQKLSEKNLFDMFLIFSLYRSINLV